MPSSGKARSSAQRADAAWEHLLALRRKYNIPQVLRVEEVDTNDWVSRFHTGSGYGKVHMSRAEADLARASVRILLDTYGRIPWNMEAASNERQEQRKKRR